MRSLPARLIALVACLHLLGGHWAVLQIVAWGDMLITYSQEGSLSEAFGKTFDGEHPCNMCDSVVKGQEEEKEQQLTLSENKTSAVLFVGVGLPFPHSEAIEFTDRLTHLRSLTIAPEPMPPRQA